MSSPSGEEGKNSNNHLVNKIHGKELFSSLEDTMLLTIF